MKTTKIISTLATLNLVLFMSIASIANPSGRLTGDIVKTSVKNQVSVVNGNLDETVSSAVSRNEFNHLCFDVTKYTGESEVTELPLSLIEHLRFDVYKFIDADETEISELPVMNEFEYLRFDVNNFTVDNTADLSEMPVNDFDYLHFDVNSFSGVNAGEITELPENTNS